MSDSGHATASRPEGQRGARMTLGVGMRKTAEQRALEVMNALLNCSLCRAQDPHEGRECEIKWQVLEDWMASVERRLG